MIKQTIIDFNLGDNACSCINLLSSFYCEITKMYIHCTYTYTKCEIYIYIQGLETRYSWTEKTKLSCSSRRRLNIHLQYIVLTVYG